MEFQDRILFGFLEGIWSLDILYQGQRPIPHSCEPTPETLVGPDSNPGPKEGNSEDQENYKRDFFAMLEDVIELSNDYPSVLIDPEFSIIRQNYN